MSPSVERVAVLVVSYNTKSATLRCLRALLQSRGTDLEVIVSDNASSDGTPDAIAHEFPWMTVLRNSGNLGYGRAVNRAFAVCEAPYILVLNSDCFVREDTISTCLAALRRMPAASAVACQLRNADGSVQRSCRRFPSLGGELARAVLPYQVLSRLPVIGGYYLGGWDHQGSRTVDQPSGAFLLVRRGAWGEGPPFDARFFMYYEDVDLCRRLWQQGPIWFTADAVADHLGEHSSSSVRAAMAEAFAVSRYQYYTKWHGSRVAQTASAVAAVASALRAFAWVPSAVLDRPTARSRVVAHWRAARRSLLVTRTHGHARG